MVVQRSNIELWLAFYFILAFSVAYILVAVWFDSIPGASSLFGHGLGVVGFVLMLMTETLYTLRKRSRSARWGRMSSWLNFHIFTGLVGPYLVLLHTSWKFNGLAGLVTLLTAVIVVSGIIGRYIYTAVPRNANGIVVEKDQLEEEIAAADAELQGWLAAQPDGAYRDLARRMARQIEPSDSQLSLIGGRFFRDWADRLIWWRMKRGLTPDVRVRMDELEKLLYRKRRLDQQIRSLVMTRRLLALWHAIHIPIGLVLFAAAFIHIIASIYYSAL